MPAEVPPPAGSGLFSRLRDGLRKTRDGIREKLEGLFVGAPLDEATLEHLEEALLASDLGPATTAAILEPARAAFRRQGITTVESHARPLGRARGGVCSRSARRLLPRRIPPTSPCSSG